MLFLQVLFLTDFFYDYLFCSHISLFVLFMFFCCFFFQAVGIFIQMLHCNKFFRWLGFCERDTINFNLIGVLSLSTLGINKFIKINKFSLLFFAHLFSKHHERHNQLVECSFDLQ